MINNLKKCGNNRSDYISKLLNYNSKLYPEDKWLEVFFLTFHTDQSQKKKRIYYIDSFDYGLPALKLKKLSESALTLKEIKYLFYKDDFKLPLWLRKMVVSYFKTVLTGSHSPIEIYISGSNAQHIFGAPLKRLHFYRKTGLLKAAKENESYYYPWTQIQELFS